MLNEEKLGGVIMRLFFAGVLIGIANLIPGVSGGTMAVIAGVYEKLISAISNVLKFKRQDLKILIIVGLGVLVSIFSLSKFFEYSLQNFPFYMYSFFFGLIFASILFLKREVKLSIVPLTLGILLVIIPNFIPHSSNSSILKIVIAGFAGGAAMVVPGLSGSLMLLLLGVYEYIISAISNLNIGILLIFGIGVLLGIYAVSLVMKIAFERYENFSKNLILGLVIGSLYPIYPGFHGSGNMIFGLFSAILGYFLSYMLSRYMI